MRRDNHHVDYLLTVVAGLEGLEELKRYRDGTVLMECSHSEKLWVELTGVTWCAFCRYSPNSATSGWPPVKVRVNLVEGVLF